MKTGILPSLLVRNTVFVLISSPPNQPRCITELVQNLRHPVTYEKYCRCIIVERRCHVCKLQGAADCPHDTAPAWFDPVVDGMLRQLFTNNEYKQEILGETPNMVQAAFSDEALNKLQETSAALFEAVDVFFVFIDPSGGGESATGVCSCLYTLTGMCMVRNRFDLFIKLEDQPRANNSA